MEIFNASTVIFEIIGIIGFALYVLNYMLLTLRYLNGHNLSYFVLNLAAAAFVLVGLIGSFNLASALIQVFWVVISFVGIILRFTKPAYSGSGL